MCVCSTFIFLEIKVRFRAGSDFRLVLKRVSLVIFLLNNFFEISPLFLIPSRCLQIYDVTTSLTIENLLYSENLNYELEKSKVADTFL
jgi:hypothetical protein